MTEAFETSAFSEEEYATVDSVFFRSEVNFKVFLFALLLPWRLAHSLHYLAYTEHETDILKLRDVAERFLRNE